MDRQALRTMEMNTTTGELMSPVRITFYALRRRHQPGARQTLALLAMRYKPRARSLTATATGRRGLAMQSAHERVTPAAG